MPAEKCYTGHMHRLLLLLACLPLCPAEETTDWSALLPDASAGVTLDEEAFTSICADMKSGRSTAERDSSIELWRRAMNAASTEERDAMLLCLLLRLNPALELETALPELIALLQLHTRAAAGLPEACAELAQALLCGAWRNLHMPCDSESAGKLSSRLPF